MDTEEKFSQNVWNVLQKIREFQLYFVSKGKENSKIMFTYSIEEWDDKKITEQCILDRLREWGIIKNPEYSKELNANFFNLVHTKFNKIYSDYKKKNEKVNQKEMRTQKHPSTNVKITAMPELKIAGQEKILTGKTKQKAFPTLYLGNDGSLWREPKDKYCYPMGEKSDRHKILRYLVEKKTYVQTKDISNYLEGKSEQSIRTEIRKIRNNTKKFIKIKDNIIESKRESGYKANPKYKIYLKFR
ncbi:MAG: hypothetical protein A2V69_02425 [Candidatus Portnoybacteria bacterium RBG_13_40_8]|uniref:Uncharacterized protein n=1 Tax=Candidatus Portnoybacteria bacterium RBG_13_40_8 TaxID=1801990 RepID=A0A1G2F4F9_9BACT|nr:MAG: hypothetical protein A2V69_02425 [Candidatus Portnoybacteria bacterium RBG_13_40_8]